MKKVKGKRHGKDHGGTGKAKVATVTRKATAVSIIKSGPVSREQWAKEAMADGKQSKQYNRSGSTAGGQVHPPNVPHPRSLDHVYSGKRKVRG